MDRGGPSYGLRNDFARQFIEAFGTRHRNPDGGPRPTLTRRYRSPSSLDHPTEPRLILRLCQFDWPSIYWGRTNDASETGRRLFVHVDSGMCHNWWGELVKTDHPGLINQALLDVAGCGLTWTDKPSSHPVNSLASHAFWPASASTIHQKH